MGPPATEATSRPGPEFVEETVTVALPSAPVVAVELLKAPRVVTKLTVAPAWGVVPLTYSTVTDRFVSIGISVIAVGDGVMNFKMAVFTIRSNSLVAPIAEAVILSAPPTVAVTFTITWPLAFVTAVAALRVLPFAEVTVTVLPGMPFPSESFRKIVKGVVSPNDRDAAPLMDRFVPVTVTVLAVLTEPLAAVS